MAPTASCSFMNEENWGSLLASICDADPYCLPILGPEVTAGTLQMRARIARDLARKEEGFPLEAESDLVQVAQYLSVVKDNPLAWRKPIADQLKKAFNAQDPTARDDPHAVLASLPLAIYATTNLDTHMERALGAARRKFSSDWCPWNEPFPWNEHFARRIPRTPLRRSQTDPSYAEPVVLHLFGSADDPPGMVLTEDDHLDFLLRVAEKFQVAPAPDGTDLSVLPYKFLDALKRYTLLFLGYRVNDFDFRILLRTIEILLPPSSSNPKRNPLIAVQLGDPGELTDAEKRRRLDRLRHYLESACKRHNLELIWGGCSDFVRELGRRYEDYQESQRAVPAGVTP